MPIKYINRLLARFSNLELISKVGANFAIKVIGLLFGYINILLISKYFGVDQLGIYSICFTILSVAQILSKFGMETSIIKLVNEIAPQNKMKIKNVLIKSVLLSIVIGFFCSIGLYLLSPSIAGFFKNDNLVTEINLISFIVIPYSLIFLFGSIFQALNYVKESMALKHMLVQLFFGLLLLINFLLLKETSVIKIFAVSVLLCFATSILMLGSKFEIRIFENMLNLIHNWRNKEMVQYSKILSLSMPMLLATSVFLLMGWTDNIMLGHYVSETQVGYFNACLKLSMSIGVSLIVINSLVIQRIASLFSQGKLDELKSIIKQSTKYIFYLSLPITVILLIFPKSILGFFGNEFTVAYLTLIVLVLGQFFNAICGSVGFIMQMCGLHKHHQNILIFSAVLNAIINYMLIPKFGILGAAIANTLSTLVWNLLMVVYVKKGLGFWTIYSPFSKIG